MCRFYIRWFVLNTFLAVVVGYVTKHQICSVTIKDGVIIGITEDTLDPRKKACAYRAIPYASPPIGDLRFAAPQPVEPWRTLNATNNPSWCPQDRTPPEGIEMSEDCLYLNVFQPQEDIRQQQVSIGPDAKYPVMIWFHGGSFISDSALHYTPFRLLAKEDVILVVPQYRLGILGFFSTGDEVALGNWGLKDQAFAIRWVNENIGAFNGDSENVKIFGQSAGAASAIFQMLSPLNHGMIDGVVAQSGSALASWSLDEYPAASSKMMGNRLFCPTETNQQLLSCLRNIEWRELIKEQALFIQESYLNMTYPFATLTPVVEPDIPGAFISEDPSEILATGDVPNIPVMLGATKHDGSFALGTIYYTCLTPLELENNETLLRNELVPLILSALKIHETGNAAVVSTFEMAYLSGVNRSRWDESMPGLVDLLSVLAFKSAALNTADLLSKRGNDVYLYSFEHHSLNTNWESFQFGSAVKPGIGHSDDLLYLFNFSSKFSESDQNFSDIMIDMWLNFVKSGNPTPTTDPRFGPWPEYKSNSEYYMKLNVTPTAFQDYKNSWRPNGFEWS